MDISKLDKDKLKSMAYDQMVPLDKANKSLTMLNQRIAELEKEPPKEK